MIFSPHMSVYWMILTNIVNNREPNILSGENDVILQEVTQLSTWYTLLLLNGLGRNKQMGINNFSCIKIWLSILYL